MTQQHSGAEATYFAALNEGRFMVQKCAACSRHVFYPRQICPHCHSDQLGWVVCLGTGTVYSTSTVRRRPEHGGDYDVSLVELDEGVRMMSRVVDILPSEVCIGMRVRAQLRAGKTGNMVVFTPEQEES